jgi:putative SOS response-associated peptidase YedK
MCGRFARYASGEDVAQRFQLAEATLFDGPRYNIAPTQPFAAVRATASGREMAWLRWGLIPICQRDGGPVRVRRAVGALA